MTTIQEVAIKKILSLITMKSINEEDALILIKGVVDEICSPYAYVPPTTITYDKPEHLYELDKVTCTNNNNF